MRRGSEGSSGSHLRWNSHGAYRLLYHYILQHIYIIYAPVLLTGGVYGWYMLVPLYSTHQEHTMRTLTGYIPSHYETRTTTIIHSP